MGSGLAVGRAGRRGLRRVAKTIAALGGGDALPHCVTGVAGSAGAAYASAAVGAAGLVGARRRAGACCAVGRVVRTAVLGADAAYVAITSRAATALAGQAAPALATNRTYYTVFGTSRVIFRSHTLAVPTTAGCRAVFWAGGVGLGGSAVGVAALARAVADAGLGILTAHTIGIATGARAVADAGLGVLAAVAFAVAADGLGRWAIGRA